jgi:hypothetical protein
MLHLAKALSSSLYSNAVADIAKCQPELGLIRELSANTCLSDPKIIHADIVLKSVDIGAHVRSYIRERTRLDRHKGRHCPRIPRHTTSQCTH